MSPADPDKVIGILRSATTTVGDQSCELPIGPIGTIELSQIAGKYILISTPQQTRVIGRDRGCLAAPHSPTLLDRMRVRYESYVLCCISSATYVCNTVWSLESRYLVGSNMKIRCR
jgi:hypothetical protein